MRFCLFQPKLFDVESTGQDQATFLIGQPVADTDSAVKPSVSPVSPAVLETSLDSEDDCLNEAIMMAMPSKR
jgi:hypothetical protein